MLAGRQAQVAEQRDHRGVVGAELEARIVHARADPGGGGIELRAQATVRAHPARHHEHIETGEITYRTTRYPGGGSTMSSIAGYVSRTAEVSDEFVISQGLRFTNVELESAFDDQEAFQYLNGTYKQNSSALTWRMGMMYLPGHDWRFSLLGSSGFRAPNVDDMGKVFEAAGNVIIVPNTDLRPETTTNMELAISKTVEKRTTFDVNAFYTWYNNALSVGDFQVNGSNTLVIDSVTYQVSALTNRRQAYLYGLSGQVVDHISDRITLRGSITYTYARIRTDSVAVPLDHIPPLYGRIGLEYQTKNFRMEGYVVFNGWKRLRDMSTVPGNEDNALYTTPEGVPAWSTMNVRGSYAFTRNVSLQVGLENIADEFYRAYASGTSAPGRNLQVSLRANF